MPFVLRSTLVALLVVGHARPATADHEPERSDLAAWGLGLVFYGSVTIGFCLSDVLGRDHSRGYGLFETAIHAPLTVVGVEVLRRGENLGHAQLGLLVLIALHATLAAHGVVTIARERKPEPSITFAPLPVRGGAGVGLVGSF
jgi:hypothetical protein